MRALADFLENKMQENQEYYPITKDNIVEVLEHNGIDNERYRFYKNNCIDCVQKIDDIDCGNIVYFKNPLWLKLIEVYFGKLKPLPKPKFDFVQYLLDNGGLIETQGTDCTYMKIHALRIVVFKDCFTLYGKYKKDKENADILIAMAKLAEELS